MAVRERPAGGMARPEPIWIERLALTNFRNYASAMVAAGPRPLVLVGANGAGKTNLLEAVSLLAPGQGLRRAPYAELARRGGAGGWAVAARLHTARGSWNIGTGTPTGAPDNELEGRIVRVDGATQPGSGVLADYVEMVWLTPAMDGLFTGPASERRRFLDRLILCFDPGHRTRAGQFERAMRQRHRLLEHGVRTNGRFEGLEIVMAETGVAIAAARVEAVAALAAATAARQGRAPSSPFPWSRIGLEGWLDRQVAAEAAVDVEDAYLKALKAGRERDRAAGRTLDGPHRTDLLVEHGPKALPAKVCSSGEQKALLIGLVLAHAEIARRRHSAAPILLLDEIAAHLDGLRRGALCAEIRHHGAQAWLTGTDRQAFAALEGEALFLGVDDGCITPLP